MPAGICWPTRRRSRRSWWLICGEQAPEAEFMPVGSLRRGCETCGDIDILAVGGDATLMEAFVAHPRVERVLGQGDTKSSVLLAGGYQADLRLVPAESRGAAMQYFTGSKAHNIALRDRAIQRGFKLNEYGLFHGRRRQAGRRRNRGRDLRGARPGVGPTRSCARIAARSRRPHARQLPRLVALADLRGDLHMHTTATDGRDDLEAMAAAAHAAGLQLHRHHRSQQGAGDGQRSRRDARARARGAHPRAERPVRRARRCWPASNATSWPTARWTSPTTASRSSISSSRRCTRISTRTSRR